jgi:glycerol-3-phosphate dehydrogenase (NAD(P)+)
VKDRAAHLDRARSRGVSPVVYWIVRAIFQPFFLVYFRMRRIGGEQIPATGAVILASNHRSFLDPFVIGMLTRRPVYYMAKQELFIGRIRCWMLVRVGAFPIQRGAGDRDSMGTARTILERGDIVLIFPEGTRTRPGPLGIPQRGIGRLALQTGAPVVPIAIHGTQDVRRGWRIRPCRVTVRAGTALPFPRTDAPTSQQAAVVTDRVWARVALLWEWLGGTAPIRRAAVLGTGAWAVALADALHRAGVDVQRGAPSGEPVDIVAHATGDAIEIETPARPGVTGAVGDSSPGGGPALASAGAVLVASADGELAARLADVLRRAGLRVRLGGDQAAARMTTLPAAVPATPAAPEPPPARVHLPAVGE